MPYFLLCTVGVFLFFTLRFIWFTSGFGSFTLSRCVLLFSLLYVPPSLGVIDYCPDA
ncbi:hypothetical protein BDZ91DRAFT_730558 [Kalaharituber pfeilii]|nr:hypothetical protein BDZ91DRAFT_730558 [Kalaharituber pfeilii]